MNWTLAVPWAMEGGMDREPPTEARKAEKVTRAKVRDGRLRLALKANMAKRKAQVRARAVDETGTATAGVTGPEDNKG